MLPVLSQLFGISIDELFGMSSPHALTSEPLEISWPDDNTIRIAVFSGKKLLTATEEQEKITVKLENEPENVVCYCNLECEIINGAASANGNLSCGNYIGENASAGGHLSCLNINGCASAGADLKCDSINGPAAAGTTLKCGGDINGSASAGATLCCGGDGTTPPSRMFPSAR